MPTYEYRCPEGHEFEVFQRISDDPVAECPECGQAAERLISAGAGFLFKGEGFYITDYRSDDYRKKASAETGGSEGGSGGSGPSGSGGSGEGAGPAAGGGSGSRSGSDGGSGPAGGSDGGTGKGTGTGGGSPSSGSD